MHNTPQDTLSLALKNLMDRVVAFFALIALAPLMAAIAIAIKVTAPGPVLFKFFGFTTDTVVDAVKAVLAV